MNTPNIVTYQIKTLDQITVPYPIPNLEALTQVPIEELERVENIQTLPFKRQREEWSKYLDHFHPGAGLAWDMLTHDAWVDAMKQAHDCEEAELAIAYYIEETF